MSDWLELGMFSAGLDDSRKPSVCLVAYNRNRDEMRYEFGVLSDGNVLMRRVWNHFSIYALALLTNAAAELEVVMTMNHDKNIDVEWFESVIAHSPNLKLVQEHIPQAKKPRPDSATTSLGDLLTKAGKA